MSGELLKSLTKASSVIPVKTAMPILENYLFNLEGDNLTISAYDGIIAVQTKIKVNGERNGKTLIPSKILMEVIRALPSNIEITFEVDSDALNVVLKTENGEYKLTCPNLSEYPAIPEFLDAKKIHIDHDLLFRLINKTLFAVSKDELRPVLTGILLHILKDEIRAVSTDGHRLVKIVNRNYKFEEEHEIVLPSKSLNVVLKYMDEKFQYISVSETDAIFVFEKSLISTKLIDEKYPNYESVIPTESKYTMVVNKNDLLSSVKRASLFTTNPNNLIKFTIESNSVTLYAEDPDTGKSANEKIPCEFNGEKFDIGFNADYVAEILNHIDSEEVNISLTSPNKAVTVLPKTIKDDDILMLLMPLRLNS